MSKQKTLVKLDLQIKSKLSSIPKTALFHKWLNAALSATNHNKCELTIRVIGISAMAKLNEQYRRKSGPTNILSFPFVAPPKIKTDLIGDIIICAPLVKKEAQQQNKPENNHWAHLTIHGVLHLLGYDHKKTKDAVKMEQLEINILQSLGIRDPYKSS